MKLRLLTPLAFLGAFFLTSNSYAYQVTQFEVTPLGSDNTVRMGEYAQFGRFRVENEGDKNLYFRSIELKNYGSATLTQAIENPVLYYGNTIVSTRVYQDRKKLMFIVDNHVIPRGDSHIFEVRAQLIYASRNDDIQLGIRRKEDVKMYEQNSSFNGECLNCKNLKFKTYTLSPGGIYLSNTSRYSNYSRASNRYYERNYNTHNYEPRFTTNYYQPNRYSYQPAYFSSQNSPYQKISNYNNRRANLTKVNYPNYSLYNQTRSQNINRNFNTQSTYNPGSRDVVFFSGSLSNRTPMRVEALFFTINNQSVAVDFDESFSDFKLFVDGRYESNSSNFESRNGRLGIYFDGPMDVYGGTNIQVTGRIEPNAKSGDKLRLELSNIGIIDAEYLTTGEAVEADSINGGVNYPSQSVR